MRFTLAMKAQATTGLRAQSSVRLLVLSAVAATFALAACSSMKAYSGDDYERGAATSEQYYKDSRACEKQADAHGKEHGLGPYDPTNGAYNFMYDACMRSSGYTRKKPVE